jgi:hypothetical protein
VLGAPSGAVRGNQDAWVHGGAFNRLQDDLDRRLKVVQHRRELARRALIRAHRPILRTRSRHGCAARVQLQIWACTGNANQKWNLP